MDPNYWNDPVCEADRHFVSRGVFLSKASGSNTPKFGESRSLTVMSPVAKFCELLLFRKVQIANEKLLGPQNFGFRPGGECKMAIYKLRKGVEERRRWCGKSGRPK